MESAEKTFNDSRDEKQVSRDSTWEMLGNRELNHDSFKKLSKTALGEMQTELEKEGRLSETEAKRVDRPPEGWYTVERLVGELGISRPTIVKYIKECSEVQPKQYKDSKGRMFDYFNLEDVKNIPKIKNLMETESAPEGWYTVGGLMEKLDLGEDAIVDTLKKHRNVQHKDYKNSMGRKTKHYNLEEIQNLPEIVKFLNTGQAPEGWYTIGELAKELGVSDSTIRTTLRENQNIKSKEYKDNIGRINCYYNVEVIRNIPKIKNLMETEPAPEGWYTVGGLAKELGLGDLVITEALKSHSSIKCKDYKDRSGHIFVHYDINEVRNLPEIRIHMETEPAPEGWYTVGGLAKELGLGEGAIKAALNKHLNIQPIEYRNSMGRKWLYYNLQEIQDLVEIKKYLRTEPAPEGWYTIKGLAKELGLGDDTINRYLKEYSKIKSKEYKDDKGRLFDYYSLEEVKNIPKIKNFMETEPAPEGWYTIKGLAKELNLSEPLISEMLKQRQNIKNKEYKDVLGRMNYHYNLEEVRNLLEIKKYLETERVSEEWLGINDLGRLFGISPTYIKKAIGDNSEEVHTKTLRDKRGRMYLCYNLEDVQSLPEIKKLVETESAPEGWYTIIGSARKFDTSQPTIKRILKRHPEIRCKEYKDGSGHAVTHYEITKDLEDVIMEDLESIDAGVSLAEKTVAFYIAQAVGQNKVSQNQRPEWLRHPGTNRKREIDILIGPPPEPGIGIEYDGVLWHKDSERDMEKNYLAREQKGIEIIHIREDGCPELTDGSVCIYRNNNNSEESLEESIKTCLSVIQKKYPTVIIQMPDINIARDSAKIYESVREKMSDSVNPVDDFD